MEEPAKSKQFARGKENRVYYLINAAKYHQLSDLNSSNLLFRRLKFWDLGCSKAGSCWGLWGRICSLCLPQFLVCFFFVCLFVFVFYSLALFGVMYQPHLYLHFLMTLTLCPWVSVFKCSLYINTPVILD